MAGVISASTVVTFPSGCTSGMGTVTFTVQRDGKMYVVTDTTPFHPLDHRSPDQPGDRGKLAGRSVVDCLTGAVGADGELLVGATITARRGEAGWSWVVLHELDASDGAPPALTSSVALEVDAPFRQSVSATHTACHLAGLALNRVAAPYWRKTPRCDSLGHPDLDSIALLESRLQPNRARDVYRVGKTMRKRGFNTQEFLAVLPEMAARATDFVRGWVASGAAVTIDTGGDTTLASQRTWVCELPEGRATYPCGGTHVRKLDDIPPEVRIEYEAVDGGFRATTILD